MNNAVNLPTLQPQYLQVQKFALRNIRDLLAAIEAEKVVPEERMLVYRTIELNLKENDLRQLESDLLWVTTEADKFWERRPGLIFVGLRMLSMSIREMLFLARG